MKYLSFVFALLGLFLFTTFAEAAKPRTDHTFVTWCAKHTQALGCNHVSKKVASVKHRAKWSSRNVRIEPASYNYVSSKNGNVSIITAEAKRQGVPVTFALKIAKLESGFNARAHGGAGEIGLFQMKYATARGLGYRGSKGGLYNASTNAHWGIRHLAIALHLSGGNQCRAASKHNGGLGHKGIVWHYVHMAGLRCA